MLDFWLNLYSEPFAILILVFGFSPSSIMQFFSRHIVTGLNIYYHRQANHPKFNLQKVSKVLLESKLKQ